MQAAPHECTRRRATWDTSWPLSAPSSGHSSTPRREGGRCAYDMRASTLRMYAQVCGVQRNIGRWPPMVEVCGHSSNARSAASCGCSIRDAPASATGLQNGLGLWPRTASGVSTNASGTWGCQWGATRATDTEEASARAAASGRGSVRAEWGAAVPLPRLTLGLAGGGGPRRVLV